MKRSRIIFCVVILFVGLIVAWPGPRFTRSYKQLQIGMPRSKVQALFGREPDYHCRVGRSEIWYYRAPGHFTGDFPAGTPESGTLYQEAGELPDVYDHVQLAFDEDGNLVAYTWIGETHTVEYRGGSVNGGHFRLLPPGVL
jgi:hypothetical protein